MRPRLDASEYSQGDDYRNELSLTVDDITRDQVMVSLVQKGGGTLIGPISMENGDSAIFQIGDHEYLLKLTELANGLVGDDFATFTISLPIQEKLTETQKIEGLISTVESMTLVVFVRNGVEHSPKDAGAHLRQKLAAAGDRITTASQFIDLIASKSSVTGNEYLIHYADGRRETAGDFLRDELAKLEGPR